MHKFNANGLPSRRLAYLTVALSAVFLFLALAASRSYAVPTVLYDSIPAVYPGSFPSLGYQATQTNEFGDHIQLAAAGQQLGTAVVSLTNWACENDFTWNGSNWVPNRASTDACVTTPGTSFQHPITLNLYNVDNTGPNPAVGTLIATKTQTLDIKFRPSWDSVNCTGSGSTPGTDIPFGGRWYDPVTASCVHGYAADYEFDFSADNIVLPSQVIYGIVYNTQTYGPSPIGSTGPYDSLNVSVSNTGPTVGVDVETDTLFWNTETAGNYCDSGAGGTNVFRRDAGCWPWFGVIRLNQYEAPPAPVVPTSGDSLVCDTEMVEIAIGPVDNIYGYEFKVTYDQTLVSAVGAFDDTWFNTPNTGFPGPSPWDATCNNTTGVCHFAFSRGYPALPLTGSGTVATINFTSLLPSAPDNFSVQVTDVVLSDIDSFSIPADPQSLALDVCGNSTVSGKVSLQGRPWMTGVDIADPLDTFVVRLDNGPFGPYTTVPNLTTGVFTISGVKTLPGNMNYDLSADHQLYLKNLKTPLVVNGNVTGQNTRLLGGDANNNGGITIADITCIAGHFNVTPGPWACDNGGSANINADPYVNIQDLSIAGGNYTKADPQGW